MLTGCRIECDPRSPDSRQCEELKQQAKQVQDQAERALDQAVRDTTDRALQTAEAEARRKADELSSEAKRRAAEALQDARSRLPVPGWPSSSSSDGFRFDRSPVPLDAVTGINWYGNTQFAYENRAEYYEELQGLHSGVDFLAPEGTPITNVVGRTGKVLSVSNVPHDYRAGPHNALLDYGEYLVLYGHTSPSNLPPLGTSVRPGDRVVLTGVDPFGLAHLHLEVIRKDAAWDALSQSEQARRKPGNTRTNPVPFFTPELRKQIAAKEWDQFHPIPGTTNWQTPEDQPDISPGGSYRVP